MCISERNLYGQRKNRANFFWKGRKSLHWLHSTISVVVDTYNWLQPLWQRSFIGKSCIGVLSESWLVESLQVYLLRSAQSPVSVDLCCHTGSRCSFGNYFSSWGVKGAVWCVSNGSNQCIKMTHFKQKKKGCRHLHASLCNCKTLPALLYKKKTSNCNFRKVFPQKRVYWVEDLRLEEIHAVWLAWRIWQAS